MFKSEQELVFIDMNEGISQKTQKPYRIVKLANPRTFENYSLSADPHVKLATFTKGEKVLPKIDLVDFFGRTQVQLIDLYPATSAAAKLS
jgi:hypothetical protein